MITVSPAVDSDLMARQEKARTSERATAKTHDDTRNPAWFKPVMFGFMIVGFLWVIVYYISQTTLPIATLGSWNIVIGFGIMFIGFIMTTRWK